MSRPTVTEANLAAPRPRHGDTGSYPPRASAARGAAARSKIQLGPVLGEVFRTYREQAGLLLPAALIVFVPIAVIIELLLGSERTGMLELLWWWVLPSANLVGTYWYQAMVVGAMRDIRDRRRDIPFGSLFSSVTPVLGALTVAGFLAALGISIGFAMAVPGLVLLTWWALISPVIVIERPGVLRAFSRSRALVGGNGRPVFGVLVVLFAVQGLVAGVVVAITAAAGAGELARASASLVANVLGAPLFAIAATTIYLQLSETSATTPRVAQPEELGP